MAEASVLRREKGAEKENVLIRSGECSLTILPRLGGKIASLRLKNLELLQAPLAPHAPRTRTMAFDESDASGWDECLPSVANCTVETAAGNASIPDHGDLWRVEWQPVASAENAIILRGQCFSLPLTLERAITLTEQNCVEGESWRLRLTYKVTNTGNYPAPWSWAAHPLFASEAGDRIVLPASIESLRLEGSGGARLGKPGDTVSWPIASLADSSQSDLGLVQPPDSKIGDKLFAGPLSPMENWCALERPKAGVRIKVTLDPKATPYLGLWICHGGWPDRPGPKQTCVALEPSTAPVDSLAQTGPWSRSLNPGESDQWRMLVDLQPM
jgi:galactose mutarotase-like enzyme